MTQRCITFLSALLLPFLINAQGLKTDSPKKEKKIVPVFRVMKPIPNIVWATALSGIESGSDYRKKYGDIKSIGYGVGVEGRFYKSFRFFADMTAFKYMQEIAGKGEDVHHSIGMGGVINLPLGAKYETYTTAIRLGMKYVYTKSKTYQPWIGAAYGINVWNVKYITWDEDKIYGKDNGTTMRASLIAGIDFRMKDVMTFTIFFETISPVADYTIDNLLGLGEYHQFDGETYPIPKIGISISGF